MSNPAAAIAYARAQLGKPYAWAAAGPASFDCSGLTLRAWQAAGATRLPHNAAAQYALTAHRPVGQAQPGDLVFWNDGGWIHHVALYIGGGQIIEAPTFGVPVRVRSIAAGEKGLMSSAGAMPDPVNVPTPPGIIPAGFSVPGAIGNALVPGLGGLIGDHAGDIGGAIGGAAGDAASSAADAITKATLPFLLKLTFVAGGLALGVLGLMMAADVGNARALIPPIDTEG